MNPFTALFLAQDRQAQLIAESQRRKRSSEPRRSLQEAILRAGRTVRETSYPPSVDVPALTNYPYRP